MRLFIAIPLNETMRQSVADVQESFRQQHVKGNFTPRENLHITLVFIGEYPDPDRIMEVIEGVAFTPFTLTMDKVGSFGSVWWTGFEESNGLQALARKVRRALSDAGIPFDKKKFRPHVTVLRKPVYPAGGAPGAGLGQIGIDPVEMTVTEFVLMQSVRGRNGMIYTSLGTVHAI